MVSAMRLGTYLERRKLSQSRFAVLIGSTQQSVGRYVRGVRMPSLDEMAAIHNETHGKVSARDFFIHMAEKRDIALYLPTPKRRETKP